MKDRNVVQYYGEVPLFSWVDINPVELCNRTCFFCPRGHDYPNTNEHMDISVSIKIAEELKKELIQNCNMAVQLIFLFRLKYQEKQGIAFQLTQLIRKRS